ncbi:MAG: PLP-dependent aminotransferase family protein [Pseudomonadota bacterium]
MQVKPFVQIADHLAQRIASGELPLGTRLPPQRRFAVEEGIAVSTASRVYEELKRRGLVSGEVGRGTYVCNRFAPLAPSVQEPATAGIDLEIMFRLGPEAREAIASSTRRFFAQHLSPAAFAPPSLRFGRSVRAALARMTSVGEYAPDPENLLLAGNGKQAIAAAFSALAVRGGRIAVESLTYPFAISAARMLGIELVPLAVDDEGVVPRALQDAAARGLDGVYLQPTLQSPLVRTMSAQRRSRIAELLEDLNLVAIEDRVYGFLRPATPLACYALDRVIQVDSLSKRLMPGISLGLIIAPERLKEPVAAAVQRGGWMAPSLSAALAEFWIEEGVVASVEEMKRREAEEMFSIAAEAFQGLDYHSAPEALHAWLELPSGWRAEAFTAACAELGIAVAPGRAFAVTEGVAPSGVRIAYSAPDVPTWTFAIQEVARLANQPPPASSHPVLSPSR